MDGTYHHRSTGRHTDGFETILDAEKIIKKTLDRLLAVAFSVGLMAFPSVGMAGDPRTTQGFSWFANAAYIQNNSVAIAKAQAAIRQAQRLNVNTTWVCTPSGFGQKSKCVRG